jgi:cell division protein FtsB
MTSLARLAERYLPLSLLVVSMVSVPFMMLSPTGLPRLRSLEAERARLDVEVSRLSGSIRMLRAGVSTLRDEPTEVERVARDQLGLVRRTDLVYQFSQ